MTSKILTSALSVAPSAPTFEGLGFLPNGTSSDATGVSGDGSVVVGYATDSTGLTQAFSWSGGVMTSLGSLNPSTPVFSQAFGTNSNGSTVVGMSYYPANGAPAYAYQAFTYSSGTMTGLGFPESVANGVSGDGAVVVGWVTLGDRYEAFRWTGGTMSFLGYLPGGIRSIATGTNTDGSVVVGWGDSNPATGAPEAFRWTATTGMVGLGFLPGNSSSQAVATNPDGSVVIGNTGGNLNEAFRWTAGTGMVGLSGLDKANAMNADGSIVVGESATLNAAIWTAGTGAESIQQLLLADGINNLAGWVLTDATGISADGTIIVGDGIDPQGHDEAWIADIAPLLNPTAVPDHDHATRGLSVTENAAHGVLSDDTDPIIDPILNDVLTVSAVNGSAANVGLPVQGLYGSLTLNSDGGYTYNANGSSLPGDGVGFDTFTYTAKDGAGGTASTDLTVVVVSPTEHYLGGTAGTTINGGNFKFGGQVLDGSLGNDVLLAGKGATVEIGGPNDTLTGSPNAADQFVFHGAFGQNEITNFAKNDGIWLDHTNITNLKQLMADATQVGANVVINDHAGDVLQLDHVQLSALHSSNFHFIV